MEFLKTFLDFILHLDKHLELILAEYKTATYFILCLIIFCETGLVATPFLPGDSLLFAAGAITAKMGILQIELLISLLFCAAILGDNVNYVIGRYLGNWVLKSKLLRKIIKQDYLDRTHKFYDQYGGRTIIIARFIPIIRTFAPFVAGLGEMSYKKYITFCIVGGLLWVNLLTLAGYYFGNFAFVKNNFELVIFAIIGISLLPVLIAFMKSKSSKKVVSNKF